MIIKRHRFQKALILSVAATLLAACTDLSTESGEQSTLGPVELEAVVDKAVATTADTIRFEIKIDALKGLKLSYQEPGAQIMGLRILDQGIIRDGEVSVGGAVRVRETLWYDLRGDLVGSYILPAMMLTYSEAGAEPVELSTSQIFVEVQSVLPKDGSAQDIKGLKPLVRVQDPFPWKETTAAGAALVILVLGWWLYRRRRQGAVVIPPTPHEVAYAELHQIRKLPIANAAERKAFCFAISETLRRYIESRFDVSATDMTSQELVKETDAILSLNDHRANLHAFFERSDGVKFASLLCRDDDIEFLYETVLTIVESTTERPEEVAQP